MSEEQKPTLEPKELPHGPPPYENKGPEYCVPFTHVPIAEMVDFAFNTGQFRIILPKHGRGPMRPMLKT